MVVDREFTLGMTMICVGDFWGYCKKDECSVTKEYGVKLLEKWDVPVCSGEEGRIERVYTINAPGEEWMQGQLHHFVAGCYCCAMLDG